VWAGAVEDPDVPDALHEFARGARRQGRQRRVAGAAITDTRADLDQFVVGERPLEFRDDPVGETLIAEHDDRSQGMSEPPQMFLLFVRERHAVGACPTGA